MLKERQRLFVATLVVMDAGVIAAAQMATCWFGAWSALRARASVVPPVSVGETAPAIGVSPAAAQSMAEGLQASGAAGAAAAGPSAAESAWWLDLWTTLRQVELTSTAVLSCVVSLPLMILGMVLVGLYLPRRDRSFESEFVDICKAGVVGWLGFVLGLLALDHASPFAADDLANQLLLYPALLVGALTVHRYGFRMFLRRIRARGWNLRHMAVIGTGRTGQTAHRTFIQNSWTGINVAYFISHHDTVRENRCAGRPVFGGLDDLERVLDERRVDGVIVALPQSRSYLLPEVLMRLQKCAVEVRVIPDLSPKFMPMNLAITQLDGLPIVSLRQSPLHGFGGLAKRMLDVVLALLALGLFGVPMLVIAGLIRIDSRGPVFYRQTRTSMGGRLFRMWKFRTMVVVGEASEAAAAAEGAGATVQSSSGGLRGPSVATGLAASRRGSGAGGGGAYRPGEPGRDRGQAGWTRRDDPRITRVGRFLRRTSLDELPQLFNVLTGDMSLVGPRPERPDLIADFRHLWRGYALRQNIKAGMTGWAQVNGLRGDTDLRKRLQYDLYYIRHWSILFDLRILIVTLFRGFVHPNAH